MKQPTSHIPPILAAAALALTPAAVFAQENLPGSDAPDLITASLKMIGSLALILGLMLLLLYLLRRTNTGRSGLLGGQDMVRVIATRALGPKKYITVVEVAGSVLTLGVTNEHISCLDKVPAENFQAFLDNRTSEDKTGSFASRLKTLTSRRPAASDDVEQT